MKNEKDKIRESVRFVQHLNNESLERAEKKQKKQAVPMRVSREVHPRM